MPRGGLSEAISAPLLDWYDGAKRDLPWRALPTPYRVWVSEIMLQQTRVEAVRAYFERWMAALPTIAALSAADEATCLKLWEGLGYYSRVRSLQRAARIVCEQYDGVLPADYDALLTLPGIGDYTAGAIASIAFGLPHPAVDGNVLRVAARLTADQTPITDLKYKKEIQRQLAAIMPQDRPGDFNQALMELGATVCLPNGAPARCGICALRRRPAPPPCCRSARPRSPAGSRNAPCCSYAAAPSWAFAVAPRAACSPVCGSCPRCLATRRRTRRDRPSPRAAGRSKACFPCARPSTFSRMWNGI